MAEKDTKKKGLFSAFSGSSSSSSSSSTPASATPASATTAPTAATSKTSPPTSTPVLATSPSSTAAKEPETTNSMNLLRLHIVHAQLEKESDPYAVVSVGKKSAKTRQLKKSEDSRLISGHLAVFDEHFVIEYDTPDEEVLELKVAVFDKGRLTDDLLGEWRVKLNEVNKPHVEEIPAGAKKKAKKEAMKESWYTEKPEQVKLTDKGGKKETGFLYMRARREVKVIGQIQIKVKEATLPTDDETRLNIKLGTQSHSLDTVKGKKGKFTWKPVNVTLDANMSNNVRDIFIECLQGDRLLGEVRVTLFDAKQKAVKKPQPILAHETKARIGEMKLSAKYSPTPVGGKK